MSQRILLATDGSASAERAADFAASLGILLGSVTMVVTYRAECPVLEVK